MTSGELYAKAAAARDAGRFEDALAAWKELDERYRDDGDTGVRRVVARGLQERASLWRDTGDVEQELALRRALLARYRCDKNLARIVAISLSEVGRILRAWGDIEEALSVVSELSRDFGDDEDGLVRRIVVEARINTASHLRSRGRHDEAVEILDRVIAERADAAEMRQSVARAMAVRVEVLTDAGDHERGFPAVDLYLARFGELDDESIAEYTASVLARQELLLEAGDRYGEALDCLRDLIDRYENCEIPEVQAYVAVARRRMSVLTKKKRRLWPL